VASGQPRYRGRQIYMGMYARRKRDLTSLTDLGRVLRESLSSHCQIAYPEIQGEFVSRDGAVRYLLGLEDGNTVESVYIPEEGRTTLCLSTQLGCPLDCRFCFTGLLGPKRNLTAGEMLGQLLAIAVVRGLPRRARLNVVFDAVQTQQVGLRSLVVSSHEGLAGKW